MQGELCGLPRLSTKVVRVFTSSTFTDMLMERNVLMQFVYPKLKTYCREKHGVEFQVSIPLIIPSMTRILLVSSPWTMRPSKVFADRSPLFRKM